MDARVKRIVCCLDGTWNNRDDDDNAPDTNVAKLWKLILPTDPYGRRQVAGYVPGIASGRSEVARFLKGAVGFGLDEQIEAAYYWLAGLYEPGDEIHLVGFSRGAYAARSLASFLHHFGVGDPTSETWFAHAWSEYRVPEKRRQNRIISGLRANSYPPPTIGSIAVWDTVGNLAPPCFSGGPLSRLAAFHDLALHDNVLIALQALALDEQRGPFRPTLFTASRGHTLADHQYIEQVWFAGSHADVGGGYHETALSDITLIWMIERLAGLAALGFDFEALVKSTRPDPLGPQHAGTDGAIFGWSARWPYVRLVRQDPSGVSPTRRLMLGGLRTSRLASGEMSVNEAIHESVAERFGKTVDLVLDGHVRQQVYRPRNVAATFATQDAKIPSSAADPPHAPEDQVALRS